MRTVSCAPKVAFGSLSDSLPHRLHRPPLRVAFPAPPSGGEVDHLTEQWHAGRREHIRPLWWATPQEAADVPHSATRSAPGRSTMSPWIRAGLAVFILVLGFTAPLFAGEIEDGISAFKKGDYATALRLLRPLADKGNAFAETDLGFIYNNGWGVRQNHTEAMRWFRKAAEQGIAQAQGQLGIMYDDGLAVPQNPAEASRWYRIAAEQGDARWQAHLGAMYHAGFGVPQDYAEAARWYRRAADQSDETGQFMLGLMYEYGHGVPLDYVRAQMWFYLAAAHSAPGISDTAATERDSIAPKMTQEQIAEAQRLARKWKLH